jgi:hypothetical protein
MECGVVHTMEGFDRLNPRVGLRRWTAAPHDSTSWKRAWASLHHDGAVTLAAVLGGQPDGSGTNLPDDRIVSGRFEAAVADFMSLLRAVSDSRGTSEYAVKIGVEWNTGAPLLIQTVDNHNYAFNANSIPLHRYSPVTATVAAAADPLDFYWQVHDLAADCVNQGGIANVRLINPPEQD